MSHKRFKQRVGTDSPVSGRAAGGGSAFTSYIAAADLQQAISKYRASGCSEAYYLLTAGMQQCRCLSLLTASTPAYPRSDLSCLVQQHAAQCPAKHM